MRLLLRKRVVVIPAHRGNDRNSERDCFIPLRFIRNDNHVLLLRNVPILSGFVYVSVFVMNFLLFLPINMECTTRRIGMFHSDKCGMFILVNQNITWAENENF